MRRVVGSGRYSASGLGGPDGTVATLHRRRRPQRSVPGAAAIDVTVTHGVTSGRAAAAAAADRPATLPTALV